MHNEYRAGNKSICFEPLATNTTCCYCFLSRDDEPFFGFSNEYKYWKCAAARENSLLPMNATRVDTKDKRVAWITGKFGHNGRFEEDVTKYCRLVKEMNLFDPKNVFCYWDTPDYALQDPRFTRHLRYRSYPNDVSAKGGGFWFHKSVLLRHHLDMYNDGDFVLYTDVDRIDFFQLGSFQAVLKTMVNREDDLAIDFIGNTVDSWYAKGDLVAAFNVTKYTRESPQAIANVFLIRNSPTMRRLMDAWVECMADWHMVTDEPSVLPNAPGYYDHRHDQAVFSLLFKSVMTVQAVVGPPARPYLGISQIATYKFNDEADPTCPFASFYAAHFLASGNISV
jgi:hypothetical protein